MKKKVFLLILIGVVGFIGYYFDLGQYASLAVLQEKDSALSNVVEHNYLYAVFLYTLAFIVLLGIGIPISMPFGLLAGYLFGVVPGALYAMGATLIACGTQFVLFRYAFKDFLQKKYHAQLRVFSNRIERYGVGYFLILQYLYIIPYPIITILAVLSNISLVTFISVFTGGSLPLYFMFAFAGKKFHVIQSAADIFSPTFLAILGLLIVLALMPIILKKIDERA